MFFNIFLFMDNHKAGFANIIGNPNAGKSTLMNALLGEKLSIITSKAQTTRHRIMGIANGENFQIVYSDTPGILKPHYLLQKAMMSFIDTAIQDADIFLLVIDINEKFEHNEILKRIEMTDKPILVLINKIDISDQKTVENKIDYWNNKLSKADVIPVSALKGFNIDFIFSKILKKLPVSPAYFPKDQLSDKIERFFVSETIREKIFIYYKQEIPYSVEIMIETFKEMDKIVNIRAIIYVIRDSQKSIIIGHKGKAIKKIGIEARRDIEKFLKKHVYLELFVKVSKDWRNSEKQLRRFGYSN